MKAILITFDQAHHHNIMAALEESACRGFTYWEQVQGRGSVTGEPHYGSHAWPAMSSAIMAVVPDHKVEPVLTRLKELDQRSPKLGLRAFVWAIEQAV